MHSATEKLKDATERCQGEAPGGLCGGEGEDRQGRPAGSKAEKRSPMERAKAERTKPEADRSLGEGRAPRGGSCRRSPPRSNYGPPPPPAAKEPFNLVISRMQEPCILVLCEIFVC
ncbi:hypothetical protein AXF42_Ash016135 [Apostasia shenzhenica]|uniref:Uncharacterized protein n=1 Tax=Apostasia shenzhenica TaxID=1088818 RepID=A0A2I0AEJ1_9ASPA|nr:hypothetical protein AXF42_Ash016135 [Apostasia shenzhenica]